MYIHTPVHISIYVCTYRNRTSASYVYANDEKFTSASYETSFYDYPLITANEK